jgi:dihydrofolate synthase/folylpolyglutamate synthase
MSLSRTLERLYARRRFSIRPGTERVRLLLERLGHPETAFTGIHVVGTNGKGSTAAFLASIMHCGGYRTAQFSSPHLVHFTERFRINGREVSPGWLEPLLDTVVEKAPPEATFFEIVTALGALCFAEAGVEMAVLEAGMGGRSDATAALPCVMTLITPISLDHCDYLGDTAGMIATEKAGIAEPGTPVVSARQSPDVAAVIRRICRDRSNNLLEAGTDFRAERGHEGTFAYHGIQAVVGPLVSGIPGSYQTENAALALAAAELLSSAGFPVEASALAAGIGHASWPGRMEQVASAPAVVLDGAHNPAGMRAMIAALGDLRHARLHVVLGIMEDKDADTMIALLAPHVSAFYAVTPAVERAIPSMRLAERCRTIAGVPCEDAGTVAAGLDRAVSRAAVDDLVLICGSLFTVGEAKAHLAGITFAGIRG